MWWEQTAYKHPTTPQDHRGAESDKSQKTDYLLQKIYCYFQWGIKMITQHERISFELIQILRLYNKLKTAWVGSGLFVLGVFINKNVHLPVLLKLNTYFLYDSKKTSDEQCWEPELWIRYAGDSDISWKCNIILFRCGLLTLTENNHDKLWGL